MMLPIVVAVVKQIAKLDETFQPIQGDIELINSSQDFVALGASQAVLINPAKNRLHFELSQTSLSNNNNNCEDAKTLNSSTTTGLNYGAISKPPPSSDELPETKQAKNLMKGFCMSLTYSASIGGSGSLVGTAPNLILKGFFDQYHPKAGMNFFTFMLYSCPAAFIMIILTWIVLCIIRLPKK